MKRLSLVVLAFALLPAFTLIENQTHDITVNGKSFGKGVVIQGGIIAVSLEDFARAAGAPMTLEPAFQLQGNRLVARDVASGGDYKEQVKATAGRTKWNDITLKRSAGQIIAVRKAGVISNNVMMINGKAYLPLRDVVRAFGDGSVRGFTGGVKPGEAIHLTVSPDAATGILIGL